MADDERFKSPTNLLDKKVTDFLNDEFGDDVANLSRAKEVAAELEKKKIELLNKVSGEGEGSPHKLSNLLKTSKMSMDNMKTLLSQRESVTDEMQAHISQHESEVAELLPFTQKVVQLEKYMKYLQWIKLVEDISLEIQASLESNANQKVVASFVKLVEMWKNVQESACAHLVRYITGTAMHWHKILQDKFSGEFDEILKQMKWPFIPAVPAQINTPSYEVLSKFEHIFKLLLDIHLPDLSIAKSTLTSDKKPRSLLLPLQFLFRPFRKRFLYHFSGNKKTNNKTKPEWYFTQVLIWIRTHVTYIEQYVQPVLNRAYRTQVSAKVEFMRILVELVVAKLKADIPELLYDDATMAHIINETLIFEKEVRGNGYPPGNPSCLDVLTQDSCLIKWLHIEKKLAQDNVDKILSSETAWVLQYQDQSDIDENKVPECAERFLTMIQSITERYRALPQPGHRLQFLELQLELIDDLRLRLFQLLDNKEPMTSDFCSILNVAYYITNILQDWCDLPFFLQMQYYRLQFMTMQKSMQLLQRSSANVSVDANHAVSPARTDDRLNDVMHTSLSSISSLHKEALDSLSEGLDDIALDTLEGTVFEDSVELFERMKAEMISMLANYVVMEVKVKSRPYRTEKWFAMPSFKELINPSVSTMAYGMLMVLSSSLHFLQKSLAVSLFSSTWQIVAEQLDDFIYEEMVLTTHFNEGGAAQFHFDMTRNFFPLFAQYTRHPENHFKKVKESCMLLTLSKGSALLLKDVLAADPEELKSHPNEDPTRALEEIGINKLTKSVALKILNHRTDLTLI